MERKKEMKNHRAFKNNNKTAVLWFHCVDRIKPLFNEIHFEETVWISIPTKSSRCFLCCCGRSANCDNKKHLTTAVWSRLEVGCVISSNDSFFFFLILFRSNDISLFYLLSLNTENKFIGFSGMQSHLVWNWHDFLWPIFRRLFCVK